MKKISSSVIVSLIVISSLLTLPGQTNPSQIIISNSGDLWKRISQLEEKVKSLEAEVSRLKQAINYFAVPGLPPGMKSIPPNWKKFTYEGQTIFLVPLESVFPPDKKK
jgi:hypothetical protein